MRQERHARSRKIFAASRTKTEIEVALDAMTLTACLACDIFARQMRLTLEDHRMAQGLLRCAELLQRHHTKKNLEERCRFEARSAAETSSVTESSHLFAAESRTTKKRRPDDRRLIRKTADVDYLPSLATRCARRETLRFAALR